MATTKTLIDVEIERMIAGVDAGHRMAEHEPDESMREIGREILRGDITAEEAVAAAIAKHAGR